MNKQERLQKAIEKLDNMVPEDFKQLLIDSGYTPEELEGTSVDFDIPHADGYEERMQEKAERERVDYIGKKQDLFTNEVLGHWNKSCSYGYALIHDGKFVAIPKAFSYQLEESLKENEESISIDELLNRLETWKLKEDK